MSWGTSTAVAADCMVMLVILFSGLSDSSKDCSCAKNAR